MKFLVATGNRGKAREFAEMLTAASFVDLNDCAPVAAPEETGRTFRANACLKASYYAKAHGMFALADDSGLAVDALGGGPGVHSARWAALHDAGSGDAANNALLLRQLDALPEQARTARFVCVLALADPEGRILLTVRDSVEGVILRAPRGENGFGYDPLFFHPPLGKTTAELESAVKHAISHRGRALARLAPRLTSLFAADRQVARVGT